MVKQTEEPQHARAAHFMLLKISRVLSQSSASKCRSVPVNLRGRDRRVWGRIRRHRRYESKFLLTKVFERSGPMLRARISATGAGRRPGRNGEGKRRERGGEEEGLVDVWAVSVRYLYRPVLRLFRKNYVFSNFKLNDDKLRSAALRSWPRSLLMLLIPAPGGASDPWQHADSPPPFHRTPSPPFIMPARTSCPLNQRARQRTRPSTAYAAYAATCQRLSPNSRPLSLSSIPNRQ